MLKKNDIITLEITALTNEGNGVGRYEGECVFVPFTAPGDVILCRIVKAKSRFCYGIIESIEKPSKSRCDSSCAVYGKCGGCSLRHLDYAAELEQKEKLVRDAFLRIGKLNPEFLPILASEQTERYRNKAQFPVSCDKDGRLFGGFYARRSHRAIRAENCRLIPEIFTQICDYILMLAEKDSISAYDESSGRGVLRHVYIRQGAHSREIMAALIVTGAGRLEAFKEIAGRTCEKFGEIKSFLLNINPDKTNVILGKRTIVLYGDDKIYDTMCQNKTSISLHSFYQINTIQAERLYAVAKEFADPSPNDSLLDLYCGAGTIGLSMARDVRRLIGVEIVESAVKDAKKNAEENDIFNAQFICSDAGRAAEMLYGRGENPDIIITDPARKGCTPDTLEHIAKMNPKRIVMISCNPATAARDCAALEQSGYKAIKCIPVDMFPRTEHVETVVLMSRVEK